MTNRPTDPEAEQPAALADYIASMAHELAGLARGQGLAPLAYILDMARMEADEVSKSASETPT